MAALEHDMGPETLTLSRGKFTTNLSNIQTYWNISLLNCRCQTSLWTARKITKKQILWWGPCNKTSCTAKSSTIWIFECCQGSLWTCLWNCRCSGQSWNSCFSHCQGKIPRKTLKWPWELTIEFFELFLYKLWFYLIFFYRQQLLLLLQVKATPILELLNCQKLMKVSGLMLWVEKNKIHPFTFPESFQVSAKSYSFTWWLLRGYFNLILGSRLGSIIL